MCYMLEAVLQEAEVKTPEAEAKFFGLEVRLRGLTSLTNNRDGPIRIFEKIYYIFQV